MFPSSFAKDLAKHFSLDHKKVQEYLKTYVETRDATPKKPKAISGYIVFSRDQREAVKNSLPADQQTPTLVLKALGARWKELSEDEKNVYKNNATSENAEKLRQFEHTPAVAAKEATPAKSAKKGAAKTTPVVVEETPVEKGCCRGKGSRRARQKASVS
jgi:hypothetical protein